MDEIKPIAVPEIHEAFLDYFGTQSFDSGLRILDAGAGHGAITKKLYDMGYELEACDFFPDEFEFDKVECKKVDISREFPYEDNSFDLVVAIEVIEHIIDHEVFFSEAGRILKPGGKLLLSTPNILSLKSRMRFLMGGFHYSFEKLELLNYDGLQHVASLTLDQYNYIAIKHRFKAAEIDIDTKQRSSTLLLIPLIPLILFGKLFEKASNFHNQTKLLLGRTLFMSFKNDKAD